MSEDKEYGKCDVCGVKAPLTRKYYRYNVACNCCNGIDDPHVDIVKHCQNCTPKPKTSINIRLEIQPNPSREDRTEEFKKDLKHLINSHYMEEYCDMPDYLLAEMVCDFIKMVGEPMKRNLDWHGCDSVCHPKQVSEL